MVSVSFPYTYNDILYLSCRTAFARITSSGDIQNAECGHRYNIYVTFYGLCT